MKSMSRRDTSESSFNCYFKKLKDDSLFSSAFHYQSFWKGKYEGDAMYTGEDFVTMFIKDSTAEIMSKTLWAKEIKSYAHNYKFYSPLTNRKSSPIQHDSDLINNQIIYKLISEENLNGIQCYHIQVNETPEIDTAEMAQPLRIEYHYWINKTDFIPIQYSTAYDLEMNNDTMYQFEKIVLNKYEINNLQDENILTLNSIPAFYKLKDFVPYKHPDPLPLDTIAPGWELPSLTDEKISLESLHGNIVLIDFFYKGCYPCMQALPGLQALHEKYTAKGLRVIGINPFDKKEDDIVAFLSKRGITYTVLLDGIVAAKDYRVSGYPTLYLIGKNGKIIYIQEGYGKGVENDLAEVIEKNL